MPGPAALIAALVMLAVTACAGCAEYGGGETPEGGERGGCCSEGTDSDQGQTIDCDQVPETCADIGVTAVQQAAGCCLEGVVYWCEESQLDSADCAADGLDCGYEPDADAMGCV